MIKLTQYSHGAGCGCKISPAILKEILHGLAPTREQFPDLIVGNAGSDDAAVISFNDEEAIISTTDFFMPIVDDPFLFGKIASVNAISDIYAMGGTPLMAISILGWPINQLSPAIASDVIKGAMSACSEAGIALAGGHSIDAKEPIFGLAVTGRVMKKNIKVNSSSLSGDLLFLTKPLGIGILTTAEKKDILLPEDKSAAAELMTRLNKFGQNVSELDYVHAMTDVTGFGLLGHLREMCEGSNLGALLDYNAIPKLRNIEKYIEKKCVPGGTTRNWNSYHNFINNEIPDVYRDVLADPQTSGGLLISVDANHADSFSALLSEKNLPAESIGTMREAHGIEISF